MSDGGNGIRLFSSLEALQEIFEDNGSLARALKGFVPRHQQLHMAQRVRDAVAGRRLLVIEAGTGTGKTFGYLVPVLLSGLRALQRNSRSPRRPLARPTPTDCRSSQPPEIARAKLPINLKCVYLMP